MLTCKHCQKELNNLDSLRIHSSKVHNISSQEVYDQYFLTDDRPKCKCGCGNYTPFKTLQYGYKEWIRGHASRVKNNWGHNQSAIDKSTKTRRTQFKNGERAVWNIGLNKETDERVFNYGKNVSISIKSNPIELERRKQHIQQQWRDGIFKVKWGSDSANWKGGTSSINNLVRANKRLYTDWIYPILVRDGFKCVKCESTTKLEVHHTNETMSGILHMYVENDDDFTFDEKREIMNKIIDYHISNDVIGETLCKSCHMELHPSYNI
jgi:hypothetical protein